eukprot:6201080-Pleurochrysis_carterae.AAC.2
MKAMKASVAGAELCPKITHPAFCERSSRLCCLPLQREVKKRQQPEAVVYVALASKKPCGWRPSCVRGMLLVRRARIVRASAPAPVAVAVAADVVAYSLAVRDKEPHELGPRHAHAQCPMLTMLEFRHNSEISSSPIFLTADGEYSLRTNSLPGWRGAAEAAGPAQSSPAARRPMRRSFLLLTFGVECVAQPLLRRSQLSLAREDSAEQQDGRTSTWGEGPKFPCRRVPCCSTARSPTR